MLNVDVGVGTINETIKITLGALNNLSGIDRDVVYSVFDEMMTPEDIALVAEEMDYFPNKEQFRQDVISTVGSLKTLLQIKKAMVK